MPRGRRTDIFATLRAQAGKALQQLERQIDEARSELQRMVHQADSWRGLLGGGLRRRVGRPPSRAAGGRGPGRPRGGGKRVSWDDVLASVPQRFGVDDIMRHPGAASKGRAQVYPALTRWETAGRVRRISKGIYEKTGGGGGTASKRASAKSSGRRRRRAAKTVRRKRGKSKAAAQAAS